jgi:hypothetical protein
MIARGIYVYVFEGYHYAFLNYNDSGLKNFGKVLVGKINNEMIKLDSEHILNFILGEIKDDKDICISSTPIDSDFVRGDLWIEWVYIINFDKKIFSVEDMYPTIHNKNYYEFDLYNIDENWIEKFSNEFYEIFEKDDNKKNELKHKCKWVGCSDIFTGYPELLTHIIKHHCNIRREKMFICEWSDCNRKCKKRYNLKIHILTHIPYQSYCCSLCNTKFKRNSDVRRHKLTAHKKGNDGNKINTKSLKYFYSKVKVV